MTYRTATLATLSVLLFVAVPAFAQDAPQAPAPSAEHHRRFVGSSVFLLGNLAPDPPSFYQLNFGYRVTPRDVVSLEAVTWKYRAPLGIPYGSSYGDDKENYPGHVREYGIGLAYQRFMWRGLYSSLQVLPLKRIYRDENNRTIQTGFRLFSTARVGWHVRLFAGRAFIEPSVAATFWPISTNVPTGFAEKDARWHRFFLGEPGLHFGIRF